MKLNDIANLRLYTQQIAETKWTTPKEVVEWMGAMQAQDFNMAKWAIGLRLNGATENDIDKAINAGDVIRTHVMRPTWHFISPDDIYWMLDLTAGRIKSSMKGRNKQLELTDKIFARSNRIFEKTLTGNKHLTRKELLAGITKAKIATDENRASHLLFNAELDGLLCSGKMQGKQTTYTLLPEKIKKPNPLKKEEALALLAKKYFQSHGPATVADFAWWSGLSVTQARQGIESIKENFISEKINSEEYWLADSISVSKKYKKSVFLLPAFDEFLISYKNRSASIIEEHQRKAFSINGIFWPVIMVNGNAAGIWRRETRKDTIMVSIELFHEKNVIPASLLKRELKKLELFFNHKVEVIL